jgi:hypothetical protein
VKRAILAALLVAALVPAIAADELEISILRGRLRNLETQVGTLELQVDMLRRELSALRFR